MPCNNQTPTRTITEQTSQQPSPHLDLQSNCTYYIRDTTELLTTTYCHLEGGNTFQPASGELSRVCAPGAGEGGREGLWGWTCLAGPHVVHERCRIPLTCGGVGGVVAWLHSASAPAAPASACVPRSTSKRVRCVTMAPTWLQATLTTGAGTTLGCPLRASCPTRRWQRLAAWRPGNAGETN
jgi:hypothetical protein